MQTLFIYIYICMGGWMYVKKFRCRSKERKNISK